MFIDVFKKDYIQQVAFIAFASIALWGKSLFFSARAAVVSEPYSLVYSHLESFALSHHLLAVIIAFVLVIAEGFYLNHILVSNNLIHSTTLFPAFAYIMLMGSDVANQTFTPQLFSNIFLLIALHNIINCYNQEHSYEKVFNASFCIALAFLFYFPSVFMLLFVIITFVVYKLYYWREWLVLLLGFIAPFFSLFAYYYIVDSLDVVLQKLSTEAIRFSITYNLSQTVRLVCGAAMTVFALVSAVAILGGLSQKVIIYRKKATVILFLMLVGILFSLYDIVIPANHQNYAIPMAFMLPTFFLMLRKKPKVCNVVFVLFLAAVYVNAYLGF
ncbi:MAG: hypothetical protein IJQ89_05445 [Bacteroidales bacterium]|nr:hypothetical protein [Bacteroidales bacterium]